MYVESNNQAAASVANTFLVNWGPSYTNSNPASYSPHKLITRS